MTVLERADILVYDNATNAKTFTVKDAHIVGQLAVHKAIPGDSPSWVITHIQSGCAAAYADGFWQCFAMAQALDELDWTDIKSANSLKAMAAIAEERNRIVKDWGGY